MRGWRGFQGNNSAFELRAIGFTFICNFYGGNNGYWYYRVVCVVDLMADLKAFGYVRAIAFFIALVVVIYFVTGLFVYLDALKKDALVNSNYLLLQNIRNGTFVCYNTSAVDTSNLTNILRYYG